MYIRNVKIATIREITLNAASKTYTRDFFGGFLDDNVWIAFIWLIVWLVNQNKIKQSPSEILKERYVKGEITKKQFEEMKKEI